MKILEDSKLFLRNHGPEFSHNEEGRKEDSEGGNEGWRECQVFVAYVHRGSKILINKRLRNFFWYNWFVG